MIDARLLKFLENPEAESVIDAFINLPQRHLPTVMAVLLSLSEKAPIGLIENRPFLAETTNGRVIERKLRGESISKISKIERISREDVLFILQKAKEEGVNVGKLGSPKADKFTKVTKKMKDEFIILRKRGVGPSIIAKHYNVRPNAVSNVIYAAKQNGETFREIDKSRTEITEPVSSEPPHVEEFSVGVG